MNRFEFTRAGSVSDAIASRVAADEATASAGAGHARYLAGGTNLIDLMKENVERPARVIDISRLPLRSIDETPDGGLMLGALATNADTASDPRVVERYPLLASAILAGASPQLRNVATNGGNINQRTRCYYFYDTAARCNKRDPNAGCSAIGGVTRIHAILGTSAQCIATHPSDMAVALAALDATVHVTGASGDRTIAFRDYHRLPGDDASIDNTLQPRELVTGIELPAERFDANYTYLKLRDRLSYAFALVSVAVAMRVDGDRIADARIALGGVAHKPWRVADAERLLHDVAPSSAVFGTVADRLLSGAVGQGGNQFKIELARRAIVRALKQAAAGTPQSQIDKRVA